MERKFGAFSSSANPQELSLTVTSIVKILGLLIGSISSAKGVDVMISNEQLDQVAQAVIVIITAGATILQSGELILGIVRKVLARFAN